MIIAVDFDGTVVEHDYPRVGRDVPGAVDVLRELVAAGHHIILNTMRGRRTDNGDTLAHAEAWYAARGIPLFGVNRHPTQDMWTDSRKVHATHYIDDLAIGCPIMAESPRRVDWVAVRALLERTNLLTRQIGLDL